MQNYLDIIKYLKETWASFEDIKRFKRAISDVESWDLMSLEDSKNKFLHYRKNIKINDKYIEPHV